VRAHSDPPDAVYQMGVQSPAGFFHLVDHSILVTRIAKRLGLARRSFQYHLPKMAALPNSANANLKKGFNVAA
jgi:hypothetical protein